MAKEWQCFPWYDSRYNEDQAQYAIGQIDIPPTSRINNNIRKLYLNSQNRCSMKPIKYLYIALFDGHGGPGVAIKASKELHQIVHEGLEDVVEYLIRCEEDIPDAVSSPNSNIGTLLLYRNML